MFDLNAEWVVPADIPTFTASFWQGDIIGDESVVYTERGHYPDYPEEPQQLVVWSKDGIHFWAELRDKFLKHIADWDGPLWLRIDKVMRYTPKAKILPLPTMV